MRKAALKSLRRDTGLRLGSRLNYLPIDYPEDVEATLKGVVERFSLASPREIIAYTRDSGSAVPRVVNAMSSRNLEVKSVKVEEPTLEDVFFNVTGERLNGDIK